MKSIDHQGQPLLDCLDKRLKFLESHIIIGKKFNINLYIDYITCFNTCFEADYNLTNHWHNFEFYNHLYSELLITKLRQQTNKRS